MELTANTTKSEWEALIVSALETEQGLTTSDAQGVIEANSFRLAQFWAKGGDLLLPPCPSFVAEQL